MSIPPSPGKLQDPFLGESSKFLGHNEEMTLHHSRELCLRERSCEYTPPKYAGQNGRLNESGRGGEDL